ncbi:MULTISPECIES: SDR family oxidoreductase [Virgibacillus]|uniref:3-oxoacyl-[acyl-carrier-protein] reductase FabG n=1 Tax=Virgibacillus massiliensis TaxID=1462526 RepID=A0A024Q894_9BACI|nr:MULTISPECIES: SDR family oxidoreductase [Virgibacillus]EQB38027.1 hypothetical protein M948_05505 [Virgibacillus sp. CM-4]MYL40745.1 SDR family oxidoreductase [Virgibacillus massiliensis]CDQ38462.1 3-oxoacyl-[acyl-carrier-protein] reductase FabG [Virgibacillus massiliensis]
MYSLTNQIAIVTGVSHGNGIGAAICRQLAAAGSSIFFTHFRAEASWPTFFQEEIRRRGVECNYLGIDLSHTQAHREIMTTAVDQMGVPTILVNNAAHSTRDGYQILDAEIIDKHYQVNMRHTMLLSAAFARQLEQTNVDHGRIIHLTSGQAQGPMVNELAYGATKGAISAFTLSLSAELAPLGITVNAVNPGPTDTGWMTEELKQELHPKFLSGRIGEPDDAAKLVSFLASDQAGWITGQVIHSEGGFLRQ